MRVIQASAIIFACILMLAVATAEAAPKKKKARRSVSPSIEEIEDQVYETPGFSLGVVLGEPTAVTAKHWFNPRSALDFGAGLSVSESFVVFSDYLFNLVDAFHGDSAFQQALTPYVGGGVIVAFSTKNQNKNRAFFRKSSESTGFGVRALLGIEWRPDHPPVGVFLEVGPGLSIIPNAIAFFHAGLGARYYF